MNGSAVIVGMISLAIIKKFRIKTIHGEIIGFHPKKFNKGQVYGGRLFGFGWAMTGACPGPLFAQIANGFRVDAVVLASAVAGTWVYGLFREKLPHGFMGKGFVSFPYQHIQSHPERRKEKDT